MTQPSRVRVVTLVALLIAGLSSPLLAGMPALLPSGWTADGPQWNEYGDPASPIVSWQVQALSFFLACLFFGALVVQWLWNHARRDFPLLPPIGYGRSLSLVLLWGLLFVVVLTMISGARELMTPGAWRKQGWTYQLDKSAAAADSLAAPDRETRRRRLEQLRTALWQYAATHHGQFPARKETIVDPRLWDVPGNPGLEYFFVPDRSADEAGRLLVFEPQIDGDDRLVLLTNGLIGTMRTEEIRQATRQTEQPLVERSKEDAP